MSTLEEIIGSIDRPEPSLNVVVGAGESAESSSPPPDAPRDEKGNPFDPARHRRDENGNPVLRKDGTFARIPGRGSPNFKGNEQKSFVADEPEPEPQAPSISEYRVAAEMVVSTMETGVYMLAGGISNDEGYKARRGAAVEAWERYLEIKGVSDLPPGLAVAVATGGLIIPEIAKSKQARRQIGGLRGWLERRALGVRQWFRRKKGRKIVPDEMERPATEEVQESIHEAERD